eukprot:GHVU01038134.1.p3 GENE.GHVU01038134.1~~GHVU01038134.1.p3  ORF type:complete len:140 (-),score=6.80 GHVU01038134.1:1366-1785(-)
MDGWIGILSVIHSSSFRDDTYKHERFRLRSRSFELLRRINRYQGHDSVFMCCVISMFTVPWKVFPSPKKTAAQGAPLSRLTVRGAVLSPYFAILMIYSIIGVFRRAHIIAGVGEIYSWTLGKEEGNSLAALHSKLNGLG